VGPSGAAILSARGVEAPGASRLRASVPVPRRPARARRRVPRGARCCRLGVLPSLRRLGSGLTLSIEVPFEWGSREKFFVSGGVGLPGRRRWRRQLAGVRIFSDAVSFGTLR